MIYFLDYMGQAQNWLKLDQLLPHPHYGLGLFTLAGIITFLYLIFQLRQANPQGNEKIILTVGLLITAGLYVLTAAYLDEVFINFEHPWNLFHHGLFSFSPKEMVLGTAELVFYVLHTPFAFSHQALIIASYCIGLTLALLHVWLFSKILPKNNSWLYFLLLIYLALSPELSSVFSSGFGGGLLSLIFLCGIFLYLNGEEEKACLFVGILPFIRPDGILHTAAFLFADLMIRRKIKILPVLFPFISLGLYLCCVKILTGQWIPNPVYFKSFKLSMIQFIDFPARFKNIFDSFRGGNHLIALIAIIWGLFLPKRRPIQFLYWLILPLFFIYLFYDFTVLSKVWWRNMRYYVGFEVTLLLLSALVLNEALIPWIQKANNRYGFKKTMVIFCLIILEMTFMLGKTWQKGIEGPLFFYDHQRLRELGIGGQWMDKALPFNKKIAVTEMSTFGFMNEREIIDLWGYTNPDIAHSHYLSGLFVRIYPDYLLKIKPEIFWWRTWENDSISGLDRLSGGEIEKLLTLFNFGRTENNLGDMTEILKEYDIVLMRDQNLRSFLLIRKDTTEALLNHLKQQNYQVAEERPLNFERFLKLYNEEPITLHSF